MFSTPNQSEFKEPEIVVDPVIASYFFNPTDHNFLAYEGGKKFLGRDVINCGGIPVSQERETQEFLYGKGFFSVRVPDDRVGCFSTKTGVNMFFRPFPQKVWDGELNSIAPPHVTVTENNLKGYVGTQGIAHIYHNDLHIVYTPGTFKSPYFTAVGMYDVHNQPHVFLLKPGISVFSTPQFDYYGVVHPGA